MDIKIVNQSGEEIKPDTTPLVSKHLESDALPEMEARAIGQVMGLETGTDISKNMDKINTILEWAKQQTEDHSLENLKWVVRNLELKLGSPPFLENRLTFLTRYAYLLTQEKKIQDEKKQFEKQ